MPLRTSCKSCLGCTRNCFPEPRSTRSSRGIRREAQVAGMEIDHLFLDQDAIPTLVEIKRSANVQARREVVAQMLDYAANAATAWSGEKLAT
jgi:uncharacterized membrane protein